MSVSAKKSGTIAVLLALSFLCVTRMVQAGNQDGSRINGETIADSSVYPAKSSAIVGGIAAGFFVSSANVVLYGVHLASSGNGGYVTFQDTEAYQNTAATKTMVAFSTTGDRQVQFNPPLRFWRGLTGHTGMNGVSPCNLAASSGWCFTVIYDTVP